jgi:uncharacterized protein (DUF1778 family)
MANRRHPILVATRVTARERALIDAAAKVECVSVNDLLRAIVLPEVGRRLAKQVSSLEAEDRMSCAT